MEATVTSLLKHPSAQRSGFALETERQAHARSRALTELLEVCISEMRHIESLRYGAAEETLTRFRALAEHDGLTCETEAYRAQHDRFVAHLEGFVQLIEHRFEVVSSAWVAAMGVPVAGKCTKCGSCVSWLTRTVYAGQVTEIAELCLRCLVRWLSRALAPCDCGNDRANLLCEHPAVLDEDEDDRSEDRAEFLRIQGAC